MAFFHLGKGAGDHRRGLKAREARSGLEASWPWVSEKGQQILWILERRTVNCYPRAVEQAKEESVKVQWTGVEQGP